MIRINLLPHREAKRKARRQQFYSLLGLSAALAAVIVGLVYSVIAGYIAAQEEDNDYLKKEIAVLDKQIEQIKRLKEQTQALLARKQVIESLQLDRAEPVLLLSELTKQVPDGIYLKLMKQEGQRVTLGGYAQSNARVSTLMRNLEASPWLERPTLIEIKAADVNKRRLAEFSMIVFITRPDPNDSAAGKPAVPKDKP